MCASHFLVRLQEQSSSKESVAAGIAAKQATLLKVLRKQHVLLSHSSSSCDEAEVN